MSGSESAVLLSFPRRPAGIGGRISRAEIDRAVARGRTLQGEALRGGVRYAYRFLVNGCSLRVLRVPGQRQSCR